MHEILMRQLISMKKLKVQEIKKREKLKIQEILMKQSTTRKTKST